MDDQAVCDRHPERDAHVYAASDTQSSRSAPERALTRDCALRFLGGRRGFPGGSVFQQIPHVRGISIPGPLQSRLSGCISGILPQGFVGIKAVENSRKALRIIELRQNEALHCIANQSGDTGMGGSYDGQAASHGFGDGQAERIFAAGADVEIGGGVEVEYLLARWFKAAALQNGKRFCHFPEGIRRIVAGGDQENRQVAKSGHGAENGFKSFDAPIVSDQEKHEMNFLKVAAQARFGTPREPRRGRKLRVVHTVGNDADILAAEIIAEQRGGALGNSGERNFGVRINAALQASKKGVVGAAMELPKKAGSWQRAVVLARKFLEAMEERVNEDNVSVQTVNSRRKNKVEAQSMDQAIPRTTERIQEKPDDKLQDMGTGAGRDFMPDDRAGVLLACNTRRSKGKALNALGI